MIKRSDRLVRNEAMFRSVNERVAEVVQPRAEEEIDSCASVAIADAWVPEIEEVVLRAERFFVVRKLPHEAEIAEGN
jgi:hypothetical protein